MLTRPDLTRLSVSEKDTLILQLFDQVESLMQTVQAMQQRIDALEGQLRKDSQGKGSGLSKSHFMLISAPSWPDR